MNPLANDWPIKHRADACAVTKRPFADGEQFYTLLFREGNGFRREDLSEEAWAARNENIRPFSFWKTHYEPPPAAPPEALAKENAEELLRRLLAENSESVRLISSHFSNPGSVSGLMASTGHSGSQTPQSMHSSG